MKKRQEPFVCTKRELMMLLGADEMTFKEIKTKGRLPSRRNGWFTLSEVERLKKFKLFDNFSGKTFIK